MAVTKAEFYKVLRALTKNDEDVAGLIYDYVEKPYGEVSTIDLNLSVKEIHGEGFANIFAGYLEQVKNPRLKNCTYYNKTLNE